MAADPGVIGQVGDSWLKHSSSRAVVGEHKVVRVS
jgi:hypothetical protein